ncbi:MAG: hypothetical protein KIT79_12705 [Deltaproteobacteria bacterium]|nr:hypothetical protein [Deltaproteobacteria bacterium]
MDLAKEFDCTQGFINHVIYGRKSNLRIQTRIAEILGEPVESIWPFATETTLPQISGGAQ